VDMSKPFTLVYDLGDLGTHSIEYVSQEARILAAEAAAFAAAEVAAAEVAAAEAEVAAAEAESDPVPEPPDLDEAADDPDGAEATAAGAEVDGEVVDAIPGAAPSGADATPAEGGGEAVTTVDDAQAADLDFVLTEDETLLERTLAGTSWPRVALMLLVLALGSVAFATKTPSVRWAALTFTLFGLGFGDGGFLSVSHITSGIWAGAGVYLRDIPLLLMVAFTLITTLVWGRVFCGFLCPFGALQDFIDRFVPKALKRPLPQAIHDKAVYAKYVVLAVIVLPALAGSHVSLYQYFEPFGTVFFRSSNVLLWTIAAAFLGASVVIPRFYCRYACPLGAALGVLSLLSLKKIERVEQCGHCKVCEQKCPTGAIRGPEIDFHECVRCNVCEVQLIQKAGVCRHDMDVIRPRLIQLTAESAQGTADA
jgi:polyferredoxin